MGTKKVTSAGMTCNAVAMLIVAAVLAGKRIATRIPFTLNGTSGYASHTPKGTRPTEKTVDAFSVKAVHAIAAGLMKWCLNRDAIIEAAQQAIFQGLTSDGVAYVLHMPTGATSASGEPIIALGNLLKAMKSKRWNKRKATANKRAAAADTPAVTQVVTTKQNTVEKVVVAATAAEPTLTEKVEALKASGFSAEEILAAL
jgi:hypothetical protein